MSSDHLYDAVVVGGGPAGSTAASLLARDGWDILLLEKSAFPRQHVGESMLPFCYELFDDLGVRDQMAARFVRKPGVKFIDRLGNASTTWCFDHVIDDESFLSFQVDRSEFDSILLDNSRALGADVQERVMVKQVDLTEPGRARVVTKNEDGGSSTYTARFLVDASGRDAVVGSSRGWRQPRKELDRTALWSHWAPVSLSGGLEEGNSLILYIGEEKKGWIWIFPLAEDRVTVGVVIQNSYLRRRHAELATADNSDWRTNLYCEELRAAPFVASLLEGSRQVLPTLINGNYSYTVDHHYGPNYAMIGDARGFIDPIFSSGVFLSMKTAYLVSDAIRTQLRDPALAEDNPAMANAYGLVNGAYCLVHRMIRLFYEPHAVSWAEIGSEKQVHKAHESAMAAGHYMLAGDFFESHERYNRFFDLLEDPKEFHRYANYVIKRDTFQELSCRTPRDVAFGGHLDRFTPADLKAIDRTLS